ncbi:hypothetical protein [Ruminococcus flavefaciens]|uniref:hypothetical protein n=1 Tax=Ruminococcus flavefaciens TaxID=1265 RepID=UPI0002DB9760|nr:hypothetical protein [Ruminococcus flavefaciens]
MKVLIETPEDSLSLENEVIKAVSEGAEHCFLLERLEEAVVITTDMGPFYDDMGLALRMDDGTAVFILSGHRDYDPFLFQQLSKSIEIDYEAIIQASACTDNKIFRIYKRD